MRERPRHVGLAGVSVGQRVGPATRYRALRLAMVIGVAGAGFCVVLGMVVLVVTLSGAAAGGMAASDSPDPSQHVSATVRNGGQPTGRRTRQSQEGGQASPSGWAPATSPGVPGGSKSSGGSARPGGDTRPGGRARPRDSTGSGDAPSADGSGGLADAGHLRDGTNAAYRDVSILADLAGPNTPGPNTPGPSTPGSGSHRLAVISSCSWVIKVVVPVL